MRVLTIEELILVTGAGNKCKPPKPPKCKGGKGGKGSGSGKSSGGKSGKSGTGSGPFGDWCSRV